MIKQIRQSGVEDGKAKVYQLDNSSLESVRKFAESVKRDYKKIDVLINNGELNNLVKRRDQFIYNFRKKSTYCYVVEWIAIICTMWKPIKCCLLYSWIKKFENWLFFFSAGMMFPSWGETKDGFEQQWGTNYLSHFLLTSLLMPLLKNAGTPNQCARIVNVSSCAHELGIINFDDINYKYTFPSRSFYFL